MLVNEKLVDPAVPHVRMSARSSWRLSTSSLVKPLVRIRFLWTISPSAILSELLVTSSSSCNPPPKAVCLDLINGFKCMPYVMRYSHFTKEGNDNGNHDAAGDDDLAGNQPAINNDSVDR